MAVVVQIDSMSKSPSGKQLISWWAQYNIMATYCFWNELRERTLRGKEH